MNTVTHDLFLFPFQINLFHAIAICQVVLMGHQSPSFLENTASGPRSMMTSSGLYMLQALARFLNFGLHSDFFDIV